MFSLESSIMDNLDDEEKFPDVPGYKIERKVGEGGQRIVYRAFRVLSRESVNEKYLCALKVYRRPDLTTLGLDELKARRDDLKGGRGSEFIEQLYNFGILPDGRLFVETEFIDGSAIVKKSFKQNADKNGAVKETSRRFNREFSPTEAISVALEVAKGLEYLHSRGYVTGDLNLNNIMVNKDLSVVKICDLDNIKKIGEPLKTRKKYDGTFGLIGRRVLPPEVMALEDDIISGKEVYKVNAGLDVYALGACLFNMLICSNGNPVREDLSPYSVPDGDFAELVERSEVTKRLLQFIDDSTTIDILTFLYRVLDNMPLTRLKDVESFKRRLAPIDKTLNYAHHYTGRNVLGRFSSTEFVYGKLNNIQLDPTDSGDFVYVFEDVKRFHVFLPRAVDILNMDGSKIEEIVKAHKGRTGKAGIDIIRDPTSLRYEGEIIEVKQHFRQNGIPYFLRLDSLGREIIRLKDNKEKITFYVIKSSDIRILSFDFDDSAELYNCRLKEKKDITKEDDGLELPKPFGKSDLFEPLDESKWTLINKLLEGG